MQTCHSSSREVGSRDPSESEANLDDAMSQGGEGWKKKEKKKKKKCLEVQLHGNSVIVFQSSDSLV